ncbi:MAG: primase-helicase family protein, partial [Aeromonas veronii]
KGAALLREMCEKLAQQQEGGRNAALNDTALIIGHYVGGGEIAKSDAEQALTEAALSIGLSQGEAAATIRSGLERGIKEPKRCAMTPAEVFASGLATPTPPPHIAPPTVEPQWRTGYQLVAGSSLMDHFKGCVYITDTHCMLTPNGKLLKESQFNALFGGYVFALDDNGDKTTRKAFEAFVESQCVAFPKVDGIAFRPEMTPGEIIEEAGQRYVNCYTPCHGERVPGDVEPFLDHMRRLIPHDGDREILMSWIASCIQNVGKKHQWSPVLVGTEGNGKSLIGKIVRYALGSRWVSEPRPNQMGGQFNGWVANRLFAIVEEIHMGGRREMLETLKPLITNSVVQVEKKGVDSYDADNRCNILMCTNHKDAVIKTKDDRRYSIIFTGQQSKEDKQRDGMDDAYFTRLWDWLENGGFAACADYFDK